MSKVVERRPVAMSDIATLLGVSINTVNAWRKRAAGVKRVEPFPPPAGKVGGTDYWWDVDILEWASRTGRLKSAPAESRDGAEE